MTLYIAIASIAGLGVYGQLWLLGGGDAGEGVWVLGGLVLFGIVAILPSHHRWTLVPKALVLIWILTWFVKKEFLPITTIREWLGATLMVVVLGFGIGLVLYYGSEIFD